MRPIVVLLFVMLSFGAEAQELKKSKWIIGPSIGYQYQENNFLKASFWGLTDLGYANYIRFDAGANMTFENKKAHFIPELGVTYYLGAKGVWPFLKTEITPYTITPKFGLGLFNILEVGAGYGFDLKTKAELAAIKGFNFSVGVSIPLNYHLY